MISTAWLLVCGRASADDILPPTVYTQTPTGVNLADGTFFLNTTDLSIGDLQLQRMLLGGKPVSGPYGNNWVNNFDLYIIVAASGKPINTFFHTVHLADRAVTYSGDAGGVSLSPWIFDAYGTNLVKSNGTYTFTDRDGTVYTFPTLFGNDYLVSNIAKPDGEVLSLSWIAAGQLKSVTSNSGYAILFDYGVGGYISDACSINLSLTNVNSSSTCASAPAGSKVIYSYAQSGSDYLLTHVTDVLNNVTTFGYNTSPNGSHQITCVTPAGYSSCKISNTYGTATVPSPTQVVQQTLADGEVWNYSYGGIYPNQGHVDPDPGQQNDTNVTDPAGKVWMYQFIRYSPFWAKDPNGNTTNYIFVGDQYNSNTSPGTTGSYKVRETTPLGVVFNFALDSRGNDAGMVVTPSDGSANITTTKTYPATGSGPAFGFCNSGSPLVCNEPITTVDANGGETDYTYDPNSGGVLTKMLPAPSSGAARPLTTYSYTQLYAYILNASGTLVPAASPIWKLTSQTQCQTVAGSNTPTCDPSTTAVNVVTNYQYGASGAVNTLLLRGKVVDAGTGKLNLRTCYGYDPQGNKIWETTPRAGLATCQ